ncbi:uncharacterized protein LOC106642825 [Copidosoma floridanum]|uniref:uncharacterized protein LOC106642825 n=1 Tax=Copidosoma floridanum TaxID=29053 RepID=UPI0006C9A857|nr:uncharacterized protein LOC106642825 [Copidosoma floridanum]
MEAYSSCGPALLPVLPDDAARHRQMQIVDGRANGQRSVDPYRELELYLARVNEEIGEIIESVPPARSEEHRPPRRGEDVVITVAPDPAAVVTSNGGPRRDRRQFQDPRDKNRELDKWSDKLLAEFNSIIANEITELTRAAHTRGSGDEDNERAKGGSNGGGWGGSGTMSSQQDMLSSDYDEPRDRVTDGRGSSFRRGSLPGTASDYDEPVGSRSIGELVRLKNPSSLWSSSSSPRPILPKSSRSSGVINRYQHQCELMPGQEKPSTDPMPRSSRMLGLGGFGRRVRELPPQPRKPDGQKGQVASNGGHYGRIAQQAVKKDSEPIYEEIRESRSRSLENSGRAATPKRSVFSRLLHRRHGRASVCGDGNPAGGAAVLVRVSSLPDQDFANLTTAEVVEPRRQRLSESDGDERRNGGVRLSRCRVTGGSMDAAVGCDFSDADRTEVDGLCVTAHTAGGNGAARELVGKEDNQSASLPVSLHSLLSRLTRSGGSCCPNGIQEGPTCSDMATQTSPGISRSSSFTWVSDCESPHNDLHGDVRSLQDEVILKPASPQNTVDDDNRSSSSSQDLFQSMDEISSGSVSPDAIDRASPLESGIGTASPPRSTDRRLVKPPTSTPIDVTPKASVTAALASSEPARSPPTKQETWERIRRRPSKLYPRGLGEDGNSDSVWIRRESVHTQTGPDEQPADCSLETVDSSSGLDDSLPRPKPRPCDFHLGLSTGSSSLSSGEIPVNVPRDAGPSSPSTGSLQLGRALPPLGIEFANKSNSAPLLDNKTRSTTGGISSTTEEPNLQQPRSQSERQISGESSFCTTYVFTPADPYHYAHGGVLKMLVAVK